jgi:hypothetical protein
MTMFKQCPGVAARALCLAVGLAVVPAFAAAQPSLARQPERASKASLSGTSAINPELQVGQYVSGGALMLAARAVSDFGVDGGFCPPGATPEGEECVSPPAELDLVNGGCNTDEANPPLTPLSVGEVICGSSNRASIPTGGTRRDTDWYEIEITQAGNYVLEVLTDDRPVVGGIIGTAAGPLVNPACDTIALITNQIHAFGGGNTGPVALGVGRYWIFVAASPLFVQDCFDYTMRVAPEEDFWGACCQPGMFCSEMIEADCIAIGGVFQGMGTSCASLRCPDVEAPANNECYQAHAFTADQINGPAIAGTTLAATFEYGLPACGGATIEGPAVWYLYDAVALGAQAVTVSLCQTLGLPEDSRLQDSVLSVFTNTVPDFCLGTFCCVAGNDDANDEERCELYSEVSFCADPTINEGQYLIVVGGYDGVVGDFLINITGDGTPCQSVLCVQCQPGDTPEGELCGLGPDAFNGGCNSAPSVFSQLAVGQTICGTITANTESRDTDWFEVQVTEAGWYELFFEAGFQGTAAFLTDADEVPLLNPTCDTIDGVDFGVSPDPCQPERVTVPLEVGTYWIFVSSVYQVIGCPDDAICPGNGRYRMGLRPAPAPVACNVVCPPGAIMECEPCADMVPAASLPDTCNDGCANEVFAAQAIACGDVVCGTVTANSNYQDLDWYEIQVTDPAGTTIVAEIEAAASCVVLIMEAPDCSNVSILGEVGMVVCEDGESFGLPAIADVGPGTYYVVVRPMTNDGDLNYADVYCSINANYTLTVTGDCGGASCSCSADLTGDCVVNADDLGVLLGNMGCTGSCAADLNGDGIVNADDLGILLGNLGCGG